MAELSNSGTYVIMSANVWYDKKHDRVKITSSDSSIPGTGIHVGVSKGTKTDTHLREMLDDFNCGPTKWGKDASPVVSEDLLKDLADGKMDEDLETILAAIATRQGALAN